MDKSRRTQRDYSPRANVSKGIRDEKKPMATMASEYSDNTEYSDYSEKLCSAEHSSRPIHSSQAKNSLQPEIFRQRHQIYRERTQPLLEFFKQAEIPVVEVIVDETSGPEEIWSRLRQSKDLEISLRGDSDGIK